MMTRTRVFTMTAVLMLLVAVTAAGARQTHEPGDGVPDSIHYYESVGMLSSAAESSVGQEGDATDLSFVALGRQFDLKLEPNPLYAQGATVVWVDDAGTVEEPAEARGVFFRGRVEGDSQSWARVSIDGGDLSGVISTGSEVYFLEPAKRFFGPEAAGETLAYRLSDTDTEWTADSCAASDHPPRALRRSVARARARAARRSAAETFAHALSEVSAASTTSLERAELGMVADYEYFGRHGANSAFDIADIVNAVDGIYQAEVGVTLEIVTTIVYSTPSDPFSATTNPSTLLTELSTWKNDNDNSSGQLLYGVDLAHLLTGRNLDGYTIGIAWVGALCSSYYGAGLSQDFTTSLTAMTLLLAHEMGHGFGAPHDAQAGSPCASEPPTYIMNPVISETLQQKFSPCSKSLIGPEVANAACLDSVSPPPPAPPTLNPLSGPLVVGAPLTLTGTGFTPGSVVAFFIATGSGVVVRGPYTPTSRTSTVLSLAQVDPTMPLGNGFVSVVIVNTDQGYIQSNAQGALLYGNPSSNIPTIKALNGVNLTPADPSVPLANVNVVLHQGQTVTINGSGFNNPLVALYTATGNVGPLSPVGGWSSTQFQVVVPANAPTGPGSIQVVNSPYTGNVQSNAVSVPIGDPIHITSVVQNGSTISVTGTGFSSLTVISLFNVQNGVVMNLGGLVSGTQSLIPLNVIDSNHFTFQVPGGAMSGPSYVQGLNPPFITPASSSGSDPGGAFNLVVP